MQAETRTVGGRRYVAFAVITALPTIIAAIVLYLFISPEPATTKVYDIWRPEAAKAFDREDLVLGGVIAKVPTLSEFQNKNLPNPIVVVDRVTSTNKLSVIYYAENTQDAAIDWYMTKVLIAEAGFGRQFGEYSLDGSQLTARLDVNLVEGDPNPSLIYSSISLMVLVLTLVAAYFSWPKARQ